MQWGKAAFEGKLGTMCNFPVYSRNRARVKKGRKKVSGEVVES